jgi:hypothetical protein
LPELSNSLLSFCWPYVIIRAVRLIGICVEENADEISSFKRKSQKGLEHGAVVAEGYGWGKVTGSGNRIDSII